MFLLMLIKLDADTMAFASLLVSIVGAVAAILAAFYANIAAFYAKKAATKRDLTRVGQNTQYVEHFSDKISSVATPIHSREKQEQSQPQGQQKPSQPQPERSASQGQREASQVQAQQETSQAQVEKKASQGQRESTQVHTQRESSQDQPQSIAISVEGEAMGEVPLELFIALRDSSARVSRVDRIGGAGKTLGSSPCKATENALVFKCILATEKVRQWWASTSEGEGRSVLRVHLLIDGSGGEVYRDIPVSIVEGLRNVGIATLGSWTIKGSI